MPLFKGKQVPYAPLVHSMCKDRNATNHYTRKRFTSKRQCHKFVSQFNRRNNPNLPKFRKGHALMNKLHPPIYTPTSPSSPDDASEEWTPEETCKMYKIFLNGETGKPFKNRKDCVTHTRKHLKKRKHTKMVLIPPLGPHEKAKPALILVSEDESSEWDPSLLCKNYARISDEKTGKAFATRKACMKGLK